MPLDAATFDLDAFAEFAIARGSHLTVIVSPNNPTARSVPRDALRRLEPHGCRLVVDGRSSSSRTPVRREASKRYLTPSGTSPCSRA
jgi:hypothetical protein